MPMEVLDSVIQFMNSPAGSDLFFRAEIVAGVTILAYWLLNTSLGKNALADSIPRRNSMPFFVPFAVMFVSFGITAPATSLAEIFVNDSSGWQVIFLGNLFFCICELISIVAIIFMAYIYFPRRLKGFGLNIKTIVKDFFLAAVNLLSIQPVIMAAMILTITLGGLIWGRDYHMQQHQQLEMITQNPELPLRIIIVVGAVLIAPVFEELLFRGLFQTMARSFLVTRYSAWSAILVSSVLFSMTHVNAGHWPSLFVLSLCIGYSYEKSGSLFRPIFIHAIFNAISVISALNQ
jgi:membrane protease YdiL (CAAX protease family)